MFIWRWYMQVLTAIMSSTHGHLHVHVDVFLREVRFLFILLLIIWTFTIAVPNLFLNISHICWCSIFYLCPMSTRYLTKIRGGCKWKITVVVLTLLHCICSNDLLIPYTQHGYSSYHPVLILNQPFTSWPNSVYYIYNFMYTIFCEYCALLQIRFREKRQKF
jgi:hypothetical protein